MAPLSLSFNLEAAATNLEALYLSRVCTPLLFPLRSQILKDSLLLSPRFFRLLGNAQNNYVDRHVESARGGGGLCHAWPKSYGLKLSHPHNAGTEHAGFSPTRQTLLAPIAKRREVFNESHRG